jgi:hypothetical protein
MGEPTDGYPSGDEIDTLSALLGAASNILEELSGESIGRLLDVFTKFPPEDRDTILLILEREARSRKLAEATAETTGLTLRLNPNTRLYVRVVEHAPPPVEDEKMVVASVRSMRMVHAVIDPIRDRWRAAMREAIRMLTPEERAGIVRFNRDMLSFVEEAERDDSGT